MKYLATVKTSDRVSVIEVEADSFEQAIEQAARDRNISIEVKAKNKAAEQGGRWKQAWPT